MTSNSSLFMSYAFMSFHVMSRQLLVDICRSVWEGGTRCPVTVAAGKLWFLSLWSEVLFLSFFPEFVSVAGSSIEAMTCKHVQHGHAFLKLDRNRPYRSHIWVFILHQPCHGHFYEGQQSTSSGSLALMISDRRRSWRGSCWTSWWGSWSWKRRRTSWWIF